MTTYTDYSGLSVVITGASMGIGAELARELSARGARLTLVARSADLLDAVTAQCTDAQAVVADVTQRDQVQAAVDAAVARYGRVDVLVNNAGQGITRPFLEMTDDDLDVMMRVNLYSAIYGMQAVLPLMKAQESGVIANVSSMLGRRPVGHVRSAYNAAKAALNSITESVRFELAEAQSPIRLVTVIPGMVSTDWSINTLGGGPDVRNSPQAQTVEVATAAIVEGLLSGPVDLYTRPEGYDTVMEYLAGLHQ